MHSSLRRLGRALIAGPILALLSCGGEDLVAPITGSIAITTATTGPEPDADGYAISVNDGADVVIGANGSHQVNELAAGSHTVRLGGMAANCTVEGENPRAVSVESGATASVQFNITCAPTTGSLRITASTTGASTDPDGYTITLGGTDRGALAVNGDLTIDGLAGGDYVVGLSGIAANCQLGGENPQAITVAAGAAVTAAFVLTCTTAPAVSGSVRITTSTAGDSPDPDGYAFAVDGGATQPVGTSAAATVAAIAAGDHTVTLSGVAGNCTVQGTNPRAVTVAAGGTAEVAFAVTCAAATGSIEVTTATTGPSPDDGYTVAVNNGTPQPIGNNATVTVPNVAAGSHQVTLTGVATNCTVAAENPRSVSVTAGSKSAVKFDISCHGPQPSAGKIAFLSAHENPPEDGFDDLYVMNPDGTGVQRLTVGSDVVSFDWAPDGSKIVFESFRDLEIYAINPDGTGLVNLTNTPSAWEEQPDWSPDGSRIAFLQDDSIYVMNPDGGDVRLVVNGTYLWEWSPDGQRIAFVGQDHLGRQRDHYVINVDGSGEANLTSTPLDQEQAPPSWSPDGRTIAFTASPSSLVWTEIYVINTNGGGQRRLTDNEANDDSPLWSPNSQRIAFNTDRDRGQMHDSREIYVMNPDGSGQINLTQTPGGTDPSGNDEYLRGWSPEGGRILYERSGRIWVMNADGSGQTNLNQRGHDSAWSPE